MLLSCAFLCTRVTKSTKKDQTLVKRVLDFIKGSIDLVYTMGADSLNKISHGLMRFSVHPDMKRHTGGINSFGLGGYMCKSAK